MKTNKKPTIQEVMEQYKNALTGQIKEDEILYNSYMKELQRIIKESEKKK